MCFAFVSPCLLYTENHVQFAHPIQDFPDMGFRKTGIEDAGAIAMSLPSKLDQKNGAPCYSEDMCKSGNCMDIAALNGGSLCVGSKSNPECDGDVLRALACPENCDGPSAQQVGWVGTSPSFNYRVRQWAR